MSPENGYVAWRRIVQDALNNIVAANKVRVPALPAGALYHYTTVEGLEGIVRSNRLWATSAYHLNDSSEIEYGSGLVKTVLDEWLRNRAAMQLDLAKSVVQTVSNIFQSPISQIARAGTLYVACFCEKDNLLSQWRAYGQRGGYALRFTVAERVIPKLAPAHNFFSSRLVKVTYDQERQVAILRNLVTTLEEALGNPDVQRGFAGLSDEERQNTTKEWVLATYELFLEEIAGFKNPAFREEEEWRVVVRPRLFPPQVNAEHAPQEGNPHLFRAFKGIMIPYVLLAPLDGKLPITQIRLGPSIDLERAKNALIFFLVSNGFRDVPVEGSDIPVLLG